MSKEYFLKMSEQNYNQLGTEEKCYLNYLGMEIMQKPDINDLENDENYKAIKKNRINAWNDEQKYLFEKRNNIK